MKVVSIPAPIGGINAVDPLAAMPPQFCLEAKNLIADGRTMKVRPGYALWASFDDSLLPNGGAKTILPFLDGEPGNNKLFCVSKDGIYDMTGGGTLVTPDIALSGGAGCGWGVWTNFVNDGGAHYLFYADPDDGLFEYTVSGGWVQPTGITGVNEADLVFVMQHMGRIWFIEKDTATAWYLAAGAVTGAATAFYFGNKFTHGGRLVGLYSWTVDGGQGIDDHLVAISSSGDVMVYKVVDPSDPTDMLLIGQYYMGPPPAGYRTAAMQGGELYLLCQYGVIPLTRLMQGALVQQENTQISRNISPLIVSLMLQTQQVNGWEMKNIPVSNCFIVGTPPIEGYPPLQYCLSTRTNGWTTWEDLPYQTGEMYGTEFYFADDDESIWKLTGNTDAANTAGLFGSNIRFTILSSYQDYGETGHYHVGQFIRVVLASVNAPGLAAKVRYDYDASPVTASAPASAFTEPLWNTAEWDDAVWGGTMTARTFMFGATGIGRAMAVVLAGNSNSETGIIRLDLMFKTGGPL